MDPYAVGEFLRSRREALQPEDVGLRRGARRRASGLRREEVAGIADVSTDYLARLERGDGSQPSEQVIAALARALRLTLDERDHLVLLAGHRRPARLDSDDHVSPGLMRILDRLTDTPAQVMGSVGETLAQNSAATALFGDETRYKGAARSAAYRWFCDPDARLLYRDADRPHQSRALVAQLRAAAARLGPDSRATALIAELRRLSTEFGTLWGAAEVVVRNFEEKHFTHPEVGALTLFCQTALDSDRAQSLLVLTPAPGSDSAEKLRLLTVLGSYAL